MQTLYQYLKIYRKPLILAIGLTIVNQLFSLTNPQIMRLLVDNYALRVEDYTRREFIVGIVTLLLIYIGIALVSRIAKAFQDFQVNKLNKQVGARMYRDGISHAFALPFRAFEDRKSGEVLQKLEKARNDVQGFLASFINKVLLSAITMLVVLGYAFSVHWMIGLIFTVGAPLLSFVTYIISKRIRPQQKKITTTLGELGGQTTETLRNVELVKSLGLEEQEVERLDEINLRILGLEITKIKLIRVLTFIQGTSINFIRASLLFAMLIFVFTGDISFGELYVLNIYSYLMFFPLYELGGIFGQYHEARASLAVFEEILAQETESEPDGAIAPGRVGAITFTGVGFQYNANSQPALNEISFALRPGETIAFVGPSGSGKTTIMKMMLGLYRPDQGEIHYDSVSSADISYRGMRSKVGYVAQDTQLFSGTIRDNLQFVQPDASDERCLEVIDQAAIAHILDRGGQGLDTRIGEGGLKLSGGERQRLAIARALVRDPDLIIFDEATSSLDSQTEAKITETIRDLKTMRPDVTTVLIAHRLSTVIHADHIYVLEKGVIVEQGTHQQLLDQDSLYAALWRSQQSEAKSVT